jgi:ABC-2 type transport system ATP-binding protein
MKNAITLRQVSKTYASGKKALDNINLTIEKGDFFGLLGPNGAGKTTLIGILTSLILKDSGTIHISDKNMDTHHNQVKKDIGVVPQEFNFNIFISPLQTIINQAGYYGISKKQAMPYAEKLLKTLSLWDKKDQPTRFLSGGMKRRLMIARALIHQPSILFLDEPSAGVDIEIRASTWEFLKKINQEDGVTIALTTHYLEEAEKLCDNIAVILQGNIIETTSTKAMLRNRDQETFILDVKPMPTKLPEDLPITLKTINPESYHLTLEANQTLSQAFAELRKHNIEVLSMRNETNRLEQHITKLLKSEST